MAAGATSEADEAPAALGLVSVAPRTTSGVLLGWCLLPPLPSSRKLLLPAREEAPPGVPGTAAAGSGLSWGWWVLPGVLLGLPKRLVTGAWFSLACTLPGFRCGVVAAPFFGEVAPLPPPGVAGVVPPPPPAVPTECGVGGAGSAAAAAAVAVWDDDPTLRTLDPPPAAVADAAPTLAGCSNTLSGVGGTLAQPPASEAGCGGE